MVFKIKLNYDIPSLHDKELRKFNNFVYELVEKGIVKDLGKSRVDGRDIFHINDRFLKIDNIVNTIEKIDNVNYMKMFKDNDVYIEKIEMLDGIN